MNKKIFLLFTISVLTACASNPKLSKIEYETITNRTYMGVTKDQILLAGEKLLYLVDEDNFELYGAPSSVGSLVAKRNWSNYYLLAKDRGTDFWKLSTTPTDQGIRASVEINRYYMRSYGFESMMISPIALPNQWVGGRPILSNAIYDLFWARMDYLLGKREDWMTCKISDDRIKEKIVWGENDALCGSLYINERSPSDSAR